MNDEQDFFSQYLDYCSDTESPTIYHRWCAISGIAAVLGRRFFIQHGHRKIYPNFYTMLIGGPGTRKGSAISIIKDLLIRSDYLTFASTKTSKEKFLQDLSMGFTYATPSLAALASANDFLEELAETIGETREVFVCLDEFQDFIGASNVEFISLLTNLWDNLPFYDHRIKTGKSVYVHEPTVNILSGSTPTGFATAFPPEIIGQGMLSRLLLIYSESTGIKITWPEEPDEVKREKLINKLANIKIQYVGPLVVSSKAKILLDRIYKSWDPIDDPRLQNYSNRRFTHLLKLCMVSVCALERETLEEDVVVYANTILSYAEHRMSSALGEFGKSKHADVSGKILQFLDEAHEPVKMQTIWRQVHQDLPDISELGKIMSNLSNADKIQRVDKGFLPKRAKRTVNSEFVNFNLLEEDRKR